MTSNTPQTSGISEDQGKEMLAAANKAIADKTSAVKAERDKKALVRTRKELDKKFRGQTSTIEDNVRGWLNTLVDVAVNNVHLSVQNKAGQPFGTVWDYVAEVMESAPLLSSVTRQPIAEMMKLANVDVPKIADILKVDKATIYRDLSTTGPKPQPTPTETNVKRLESVQKSLVKAIADKKVTPKNRKELAATLAESMDVVSTLAEQLTALCTRIRSEAIRPVPADETYPLPTADVARIMHELQITGQVLAEVKRERDNGGTGAKGTPKGHEGNGKAA